MLILQMGRIAGSFNSHSNIFFRFLSRVFSFHVGAETEEAAPVPQQPVAVMAEVAAAPPQPTTDSLLGDLLDMGPSQPVAAPSMAPAQPAGRFYFNSELLCSPLFILTVKKCIA